VPVSFFFVTNNFETTNTAAVSSTLGPVHCLYGHRFGSTLAFQPQMRWGESHMGIHAPPDFVLGKPPGFSGFQAMVDHFGGLTLIYPD